MADATKKKFTNATTPIGLARYCFVNTPQTKFNPDGVFKCDLVVPQDEAASLMTAINKEVDQKYAETINTLKGPQKAKLQKSYPYEEDYNDAGEPTGAIVFKTKLKAVIKRKDGTIRNQKPQLFNVAGKPLDAETVVYSGSRVRLNVTLIPWYVAGQNKAGISLELKAVQAIELAQGAQRSAEAYGFGDESGGMGEMPDTQPDDPGPTEDQGGDF